MIVVTGGAGYVGSHAAKALRQAGHEVVIYDDLSAGHRAAALGARLIEGNIADVAAVRRAIRETGATAVMHFAAWLVVPDSVKDPKPWRRRAADTSCSHRRAPCTESLSKRRFAKRTRTTR